MRPRLPLIVSAACLVACCGLCGVAGAQDKMVDLTKPAPKLDAPTPSDPAAQAVIDRALKAYRDLSNYSDRFAATMDIAMKDADGADAPDKHEEKATFVFSKPAKFALRSSEFSFFSDGVLATVHAPGLRRYKQMPVATKAEWEAFAGEFADALQSHPVAAILVGQKPGEFKFDMISRAESVAPQERNGKPGKLVKAKMVMSPLMPNQTLPGTLWFADDTGLMGEMTLDLADSYRQMVAAEGDSKVKIEKAELKIVLDEIKIDKEPSAEAFTFTPGKRDKKVDDFSISSSDATQEDMIGSPAPAFTTKTLDGKEVTLESLKGKIVVLDFWATWCPPCREAIPHLQAVHEKFKGQDVVVLGINQDRPGSDDKIRAFIEKNKMTFAQGTDTQRDIALDYAVNGIPSTIFIDKKGIVQAVHTGFSEGDQKYFNAFVEKLVAGENLFTPEEIEARKKAAAAAAAESEARKAAEKAPPKSEDGGKK